MSNITAWCHITEDSAFFNGEKWLAYDPESEEKWFKQIYKKLGLSYPKFYKMDQLAQAGLLGFEILRSENDPFLKYRDDEIAMVFANRTASAVTDVRFLESYEVQHSPSPSLFVYTLPNIAMGELAILNKWYGENIFAVLPNFASDFYANNARILFGGNAAKAMLGGWIELSGDSFEVFLFFVESETQGGVDWTEQALVKLFEQKDLRLKETN